MRAVEDDHVDRPDVQARQRVELTGTNRSTGLIALMIHVRIHTSDQNITMLARRLRLSLTRQPYGCRSSFAGPVA